MQTVSIYPHILGSLLCARHPGFSVSVTEHRGAVGQSLQSGGYMLHHHLFSFIQKPNTAL